MGHPGCRETPTQNSRKTPTRMGGGGKRLGEEETQELEERNTHGEVRAAETEREQALETEAEIQREDTDMTQQTNTKTQRVTQAENETRKPVPTETVGSQEPQHPLGTQLAQHRAWGVGKNFPGLPRAGGGG